MKKPGFLLFSFLNLFVFLFFIIFFLDFQILNGSLFGIISLKFILFLKKATGLFIFLYTFLFLYCGLLILLAGSKKNIYLSYFGFLLLLLSLSMLTYKITASYTLAGTLGQFLFNVYPFKSGLLFMLSFILILAIAIIILLYPAQIYFLKIVKKIFYNIYDFLSGKKTIQEHKKIKIVKKRAIGFNKNNRQIMAYENSPDPFKIAKADIDEYYRKQAHNDENNDSEIYEQDTEFEEPDVYQVHPDNNLINKNNIGNTFKNELIDDQNNFDNENYIDFHHDNRNDFHHDNRNDFHHDNRNDFHHDNRNDFHHDNRNDFHHDNRNDFHHDNRNDFHHSQNNEDNLNYDNTANEKEFFHDFSNKNSEKLSNLPENISEIDEIKIAQNKEISSNFDWLDQNEKDIIIKNDNKLEELPVINNKPQNRILSDNINGSNHDSMFNDKTFDIDETEFSIPSANKRNIEKYIFPDTSLLHEYEKPHDASFFAESNHAAKILENTLREFKITSKVIDIQRGPVVTLFKIIPAPGIKLSKISGLADNIALKLAASRVRIVAPIPGERAVGIELPNKNREIVSFYEVVSTHEFKNSKHKIPIALGKDISGNIVVMELTDCPHLLISGATGSGKSVCVNTLISSVLYSKSPKEVKLMLIDPKIVELKLYNDIPHLITPVITDPKQALAALKYMLAEMERRYGLLDQVLARDITNYNRKVKQSCEKLPFIIVIIDELADLMMILGKQIEGLITRLAAMSRAVGIHLVVATQRPSVDVITGLIKANIPSRIAFQVSSRIDSRTILDEIGAEKLIGKGDMLYLPGNEPNPIRIQGAFLVEDEVIKIVEHLKSVGEPNYIYFDEELLNDENKSDCNGNDDDPLFSDAVDIILKTKRASASFLQRRLKIGYNRAARIIEKMEEKGIIGAQQGSKPRAILDDGIYSQNSPPL